MQIFRSKERLPLLCLGPPTGWIFNYYSIITIKVTFNDWYGNIFVWKIANLQLIRVLHKTRRCCPEGFFLHVGRVYMKSGSRLSMMAPLSSCQHQMWPNGRFSDLTYRQVMKLTLEFTMKRNREGQKCLHEKSPQNINNLVKGRPN